MAWAASKEGRGGYSPAGIPASFLVVGALMIGVSVAVLALVQEHPEGEAPEEALMSGE